MQSITYTIQDAQGIHARPAGLLVKQMQEYPCDVTIQKGEAKADAKKLFALMKLAVKCGETVTITTEGEQEEDAIAAVQAFMKTNL